ncbi:MAG: DUF427 domain-containing protein [Pseudomonadota bacterium]
MVTARWNGEIIAQSDATIVVENNHYFPRVAVNEHLLVDSDTTSFCPWKGEASYYSLNVDGETNTDAAWYYPEPKEKAASIRDHIAFWKGVEIS